MAAGFKTATVNAASVPSTQTNYPAYVDLSRLGITTLAEAQSVRVYAESTKTTEWAREIVSATEMHVKVPSLTSTVEMYVDWDGSSVDYAVTDTYGRNAVWSDHLAVYHLNEASGNANDSTVNALTLTNTTSKTYTTAKVGNGIDFGSTVRNTTEFTRTSILSSNASVTMSVWFKMNTALSATHTNPGLFHLPYKSGSGSVIAIIPIWNAGTPRIQAIRRASVDAQVYTSFANDTTDWHNATIVYDSGATKLYGYLDGAAFSTTNVTSSGTYGTSAYPVSLGGSYMSNNAVAIVDETRVRTVVQSANWTTTEYNNFDDEAAFWGTWSDVTLDATVSVSDSLTLTESLSFTPFEVSDQSMMLVGGRVW